MLNLNLTIQYYKWGYYTIDTLKLFVEVKMLTQEQYDQILNPTNETPA